MRIIVDSLLVGASRARGTVVVVDVFRCFTTAAYALAAGAKKIILVAEPDRALALRRRGDADLCIGEVDGRPPPGFDCGNSPYEIRQLDLKGKTLIQSTRAGVAGVCAANKADAVFGASFVNAAATVKALQKEAPELITIVAMGLNGKKRTDEDDLCALYLKDLLDGRQSDVTALRAQVLASAEAKKFSDPTRPWFHPEDLTMALEFNAAPVAVQICTTGDKSGELWARALT